MTNGEPFPRLFRGYVIDRAIHGYEVRLPNHEHIEWAVSVGEAKRLIDARIERLRTRTLFTPPTPSERKRASLADLRAAAAARRNEEE